MITMKRFFLTLMICLVFQYGKAYGQEFYRNDEPILSQLYQWCIWSRYQNNFTERMYLYFMETYRTFNGITYLDIFDLNEKSYYVRFKDDKLYRYDETQKLEYVLFDFGLKEGDVFETRDGRKMRVEAVVDTVFQNPYEGAQKRGPYKLQKMVDVSDTSYVDEWLEGFGSLKTSVLSTEELDEKVLECHLLWGWYFPVYFFYNSDFLKTQIISMDKAENFNDKTPDTIFCEFVGDTLIISGNVYRTCAGYYYLSCDIQDSIISFEINEINASACAGIYNIYARFSGFKGGTYTFRYKGWSGDVIEKTVVCENANKVTTIVNQRIKTKMYDLSGRSLTSPPDHGLYIQSGKVMIKR